MKAAAKKTIPSLLVLRMFARVGLISTKLEG